MMLQTPIYIVEVYVYYIQYTFRYVTQTIP
jgi:hypothetical protein